MRLRIPALLACAPLLLSCATSADTIDVGDDEPWEITSEISDFNRQITVYVDGEEALVGRLARMPDAGTRDRSTHRGRDMLINCRKNPIVYGVDCVLRVDGRPELTLTHVFE
ncbi:MAG: hypothetical protein LAT50_14400 [Ectothiorhodospiraceae bacterium]|nr:hypothetical protein [Ectothiorhodospiraceae bacterium]